MIIRSIGLQNIRSYVNTTIPFPDGSVLLSGDIGSGKTTVLLAIEFALFGIIRGSVDGTTLLRHGCNAGSVTLIFSLDGHDVTVHRPLKRGKNGVSQSPGYLVVDGMKTDCMPVELKSRVLEMIGYPVSLLTKSKELIYRYTVYTPQEEMNRILFEDAALRLETLRRVFQIDRYKVVRENAQIAIRAAREREKLLAIRVADLLPKQSRREALMKVMGERKNKLSVTLAEAESATIAVREQQSQLFALEEQLASVQKLRQDMAAVEASLVNAARLAESHVTERQRLLSSLDQMSSFTTTAAIREQFEQGVAALRRAVLDFEAECGGRQRIDASIAALDEELSLLTAAVAAQQSRKGDAEALLVKVTSLAECPLCLQSVSERHKQHIRTQERAKIRDADLALTRVSATRNIAEKRRRILQETISRLNERGMVIAEARAWLAGCESLVSSDAVAKDADVDVAFRMRSLTPLRRRLEEAQRAMALRKEKEEQLAWLGEKIAAAGKDKEALQERQKALSKQLQDVSPLEQQLSSARATLDALRRQERDAAVRKASLEAELSALSKESEALQHDIAAMEEAGNELEHLAQWRHWMDAFLIPAAEVMEKRVMLRIYHEFNDLFRQWFGILLSDEAVSARLDDTFTPVIEQNGYETMIQNLSGGEKTSCALAYRLALNHVINDLVSTIKTKGLIILDEPTDGFSSEQLEKVRDVLDELNLSQVILVSHEAKVESFVQNVIRVVKEHSTSKVLV